MSVAGNVTSRNYMAKVAKRGFQGCDQIFQGDQIKQTYLLSRWDGKWLDFFCSKYKYFVCGNFKSCGSDDAENEFYLKLHFLEIFPILLPPSYGSECFRSWHLPIFSFVFFQIIITSSGRRVVNRDVLGLGICQYFTHSTCPRPKNANIRDAAICCQYFAQKH